jgi:chemotaxis protein CheD
MFAVSAIRAKKIVLHPGDYEIKRPPVVLSTLLGSCVAVCMYDPPSQILGMNHFLLPVRRHLPDTQVLSSDGGRYGIHAMELLINGLLQQGAHRTRLKAKAFGGGNVLGVCKNRRQGFECVSMSNVRFVQEFLQHVGIPLVAADLGGTWARQIYFTGEDFSVYVRKISSSQSKPVLQEERHHWYSKLDRDSHPGADFW